MSAASILDQQILASADAVKIWVANRPAPKDVWSLREAIAWARSQPSAESVRLFCPGGSGQPSIWLSGDEIIRLAQALGCEAVAA